VAFRISSISPEAFGSCSFGLIAMRVLFDALEILEAPVSGATAAVDDVLRPSFDNVPV
jgi:hypothetical protein